MKIAWTVCVLLFLSACSSNRVQTCEGIAVSAESLREAKAPQELGAALSRLLTAHCRCDFGSALREEITFDGRNVEVGFDPAKAECLGPLKVVAAETSLPNLGSLTVEQDLPQGGGTRFVIAFVHNGSRWLLYWPAPEKQQI